MTSRTEASIEQSFVKHMRDLGITTLKLTLNENAGYPDRLVILPNGGVLWIELKRERGKLRPLQVHRHRELERLGHTVKTFYCAEDAITFVASFL